MLGHRFLCERISWTLCAIYGRILYRDIREEIGKDLLIISLIPHTHAPILTLRLH